MQLPLQRTVSAGMLERPNFAASMTPGTSVYVPRRSIYDPLYKNGPQPIVEPNTRPPPPTPPIEDPSPVLLAGLAPRPVSPSGYPVNDNPVPQQLVDWRAEFGGTGGFWGKIANYYTKKHEASASVYRSPFAQKVDPGSHKLADAYYNSLGNEDRLKIDDYKTHGMRN